MSGILQIPEIAALNAPGGMLRIPDQVNVPITSRIKKVIDCAEFKRLRGITQLGLVSHVYPGATHSRFEHSMGVYRMALLFLQKLASVDPFSEIVNSQSATELILAALLHDIGHYPFCHPIEDIGADQFTDHEHLARLRIQSESGEIANIIEKEFGVSADRVIGLIERKRETTADQLMCSILSGPIDVDKMDYLYRDSLHAGVPYGRNFDAPRLISSLCLSRNNDRLAITEKGRTAAELLVFARYVMFSEVYWHHAVRSATAMFQRAVFRLFPKDAGPADDLYRLEEPEFIDCLFERAQEFPQCHPLLNGIFGRKRQLYKRAANYSCLENESMYRRLARRPYSWLTRCSERLSELLSQATGQSFGPEMVLIDAPPVGLEVQFDVDVFYSRNNAYRPLGEVSPVVNTLAKKQFDDLVKQVRVFVEPGRAKSCSDVDLDRLLCEAVDSTDA